MSRSIAVAILAIAVLLLSACASAGEAVADADTTVSIPAMPQSERPFAEAIAASQPVKAAAPEAPEDLLPVPAAESSAEPAAEEPAQETALPEVPELPAIDKNISIPFTIDFPVVETPSPVKAEEPIVAAEEEDAVEDVHPEPVLEEPAEAASEEPQVSAVLPEEPVLASSVNPEMDRWMVQLMISSVAIVILFTLATAIRGIYRMQLPRLLSAALSAALALLPMVISAVIGGLSLVWLAYLVLAFSYIIFRGRGTRGFR